LRANFYSSSDEYVKYATAHFNMPTNNGGMYLAGYPVRKDNHAEFVAYERDGGLWNLSHEYIHYLDGRFNRYGDYCNGLHEIMLVLSFVLSQTHRTRTVFGGRKVLLNILLGVKTTQRQRPKQPRRSTL
jgi:hypothetical protein